VVGPNGTIGHSLGLMPRLGRHIAPASDLMSLYAVSLLLLGRRGLPGALPGTSSVGAYDNRRSAKVPRRLFPSEPPCPGINLMQISSCWMSGAPAVTGGHGGMEDRGAARPGDCGRVGRSPYRRLALVTGQQRLIMMGRSSARPAPRTAASTESAAGRGKRGTASVRWAMRGPAARSVSDLLNHQAQLKTH
jgi:hypothetical protein